MALAVSVYKFCKDVFLEFIVYFCFICWLASIIYIFSFVCFYCSKNHIHIHIYYPYVSKLVDLNFCVFEEGLIFTGNSKMLGATSIEIS